MAQAASWSPVSLGESLLLAGSGLLVVSTDAVVLEEPLPPEGLPWSVEYQPFPLKMIAGG